MLISYQYAYTVSMTTTTQRLGYLLKRAQNAFRTRMDRALDEIGLTTSQYAVLAALEEEPGLSNADLARRSFVTPQTMIRIVTALEERSLLTRHARSDNARVRAAAVTDEGRRLLRTAHLVVAQIEREMTSGASQTELNRLATSLAEIARRLESG
jgi:DNA-binding MarR family transcriptional regulator